MLGRKFAGSASFVCLRCRLQLARTSRSIPFAARALASLSPLRHHALRQQQRSLSSHAPLPNTDADEPAQQSDRDPHDGANDNPRTSVDDNADSNAERATNKAGSQADSRVQPDADAAPSSEPCYPYPFVKPPDLGQSYEPPAPQLYKSRGRIVSPGQEGLSIDILGKPAFAVVLRDCEGLEKQQELPVLQPDGSEAAEQVDPATFLSAEENTEATREEVMLNIHELKPTDTACLSEEEFDALKETLMDGFTSSQLADYIKDDQESRRFSGDIENTLVEAPWVEQLQPWAPLTLRPAAGGLNSHLSGYITNARSRKERLAVQVLRECWDVGSKDDVDRDGSTSITLRDVEFSILTVGNRRWLEGMSRPILAQVKEVRFVRKTRTVSIIGPRYPTRLILERIEKVVSTCRTADFPVTLVSPEPGRIDAGILNDIGRVTNTVTRFDPSGKKIVVTWMQMSKRNQGRENAAETVLRFLREAYWPNPRVSNAVHDSPAGTLGRYIPILNCADKLPWHQRDKKWARLSSPVSKESPEKDHRALFFNLPFPVGLSSVPEQHKGSGQGWSLALKMDTSAVFGHVGFLPKEPPSPEPTLVALDPSLPRTFVPTLPSLFSINLPNNLHEPGLWHTTTVIRFAPSPDTPPELAASAPTLALRIDADHRQITGCTSLRAIKHTFTNDYLLPAGTVDVRLVQQQYFEIPGDAIRTHIPPLNEFLNKSDLRPWESKFSTPPGLSGVRLPQRFFSPSPSSSSSSSAADKNSNSEDTPPAPDEDAPPAPADDDDDANHVQLDYTLASVEVRRDVTAAYARHRVRYTRVRAGAPGGEWSQLSLDAVRLKAREDDAEAEAEAPYGIVGHRMRNSRKFLFHTANNPRKKAELEDAFHPVDEKEFFIVVRRISRGTEDFKWVEW